MKQLHLHISGFVQGVGFRVFLRNKARKIAVETIKEVKMAMGLAQ